MAAKPADGVDPFEALESRLALARRPNVDPHEKIDALVDLAWALRNTKGAEANALAKEARELAIQHGYKLAQARAARTMAMTTVDDEGLRGMLDLAEEAKRLFDEVNDAPGRAASRDFLSSLHEYIGDLGGGLELALDALSIAREIGDPIRQGYALSSVGGILAASGEVDQAVQRLKEALSLFERAQDSDGVGTICSRLCKVFKNAGRNEEALTYAQRCYDVAEAIESEYGRWSALTVVAQIEEERGHEAKAKQLYEEALDSLSAQISKEVIGAETRVALAHLLFRQGKHIKAEESLSDVLRQIEGRDVSIVVETAAHDALADLYEHQGALAKALEHLRKARALREKIAQRDARNKLTQLDVRAAMEAARKDAEIHRLRFVELHEMQSKLMEAEKMALLGKLAAGTAHELNTPLGVLRSNNELSWTAIERLFDTLPKNTDVQTAKLVSALESCKTSSDAAITRIAYIAQSFKRFTQLDQAERRAFDVREGLDSALALLAPSTPETTKLERHFKEIPRIEGWPRELNYAFMTVLQNAVQALEGPGVVSVHTSATHEHVLVQIRDTGRGMSEEQVAHLFDVAWSKEGARTSMRLGLSAAYTTMQKHRGAIEVRSAIGSGTTVTFRFPVSNNQGLRPQA